VRGALERGREAYRQRSWDPAYRHLLVADGLRSLPADDLWKLASAAHLTGHDDEGIALLERTHRAYLSAAEPRTAARYAFWLGFRWADRGEMGQATGWFGRAQRLAAGDPHGSFAAAQEAATIGRRFGDADLFALALHGQGRARLRAGRVDEGLALLDEAMVAVTGQQIVVEESPHAFISSRRPPCPPGIGGFTAHPFYPTVFQDAHRIIKNR
jgi:hypothetical protein